MATPVTCCVWQQPVWHQSRCAWKVSLWFRQCDSSSGLSCCYHPLWCIHSNQTCAPMWRWNISPWSMFVSQRLPNLWCLKLYCTSLNISGYVAVPGRNRTLFCLCISIALLRSKCSSTELPLRAGLISTVWTCQVLISFRTQQCERNTQQNNVRFLPRTATHVLLRAFTTYMYMYARWSYLVSLLELWVCRYMYERTS